MLVADTESQFKELEKVLIECEPKGRNINCKETECKVGNKTNPSRGEIQTGDKQVPKFKYLF